MSAIVDVCGADIVGLWLGPQASGWRLVVHLRTGGQLVMVYAHEEQHEAMMDLDYLAQARDTGSIVRVGALS